MTSRVLCLMAILLLGGIGTATVLITLTPTMPDLWKGIFGAAGGAILTVWVAYEADI